MTVAIESGYRYKNKKGLDKKVYKEAENECTAHKNKPNKQYKPKPARRTTHNTHV